MPKLVVNTEINQDGVDKGIAEIEKKMAKLDARINEIWQNSENRDLTPEEKQEFQELTEEYNRLFTKTAELARLDTDRLRAQQDINAEALKQTDNTYRLVDGVITTADGKRYILKTEEEITQEEEEQNQETREHIANIDKVGKGLQGVVKKVGRWGLAIIGVRSAYAGIRKAMSLVQSQNEGIANTFKVMSVAIANTLTPVVEKIVNIIKNLMLYIDYIYFRLTSKHLFNFTKAFEDANKSASATAKTVNKITTSFDEMNVVQDTSSSGGGGGMGANPFEGWEDFQPPKWLETITSFLEKIKKNWKAYVVAILSIGAGLLIFKALGKAGGISGAITGILELIALLGGLALVLMSLTELMQTLNEGGISMNDTINFMLTLFTVLAGLMATIVLLGPSMTAGLVPFSILVAEISAILLVMKATLPTILDAVSSFITTTAPALVLILETIGANITSIIYALGTVLPPIINSVGKVFDTIFKGIERIIRSVGDVIIGIMREARTGVVTVLNAILDFINRLGPAINRFVDNCISAVTKLINFMVSGIEYLVNTLVIDALRGMIRKINDMIPGEGLDIKLPNYVSIQRFRPRLAKGGIVNMPSKGVPVGSAIAGERGAEGVIPLTDSQQMELLGEAIGKYININATVPVYVGNRMVARELKRINAEDNFAYNR